MRNSIDGNTSRLLTISKAADMLGISPDNVKELLLDPELPRMKFDHGKRVRLPQNELLEYVKKRSRNWFDYC
ncbi:DNA-binding protein [Levilactobacillus suantsaiihabitans]|uniref:DNA-binding protein n=2 Tax=Levilactobacillus suantsaiihabitans TaxID=2487722 RepID=A0A4Z0J997_9LACO|nr:DNA-binding protein [Levilactobacillus suantsaiihabitans]